MKVFLTGAIALMLALSPFVANAAPLEVSGWIPYWTSGAPKAAERRLRDVDVIHPFGYSVKSDGTLLDNMKITKGSWKSLVRSAQKKDVLVVPTITTANGPLVHELLSDPDKRADHVREIAKLVKKRKFDGIDIDYEGKFARTQPYFSLFLEELKEALGDTMLSCTIEARTPPESLYRTIPATLEYANDYDAVNEHCDRVNIMAYDQQRADISENDANRGAPYVPVSDVDWVRKVLELALKDIDADKIVLGIPTYGHEYEVLVTPQQYAEYRRVGAYNIPAIEKKVKSSKSKAGRASSGELAASYLPAGNHSPQASYDVQRGTPDYLEAAAQSLAYTNATGISSVFYYITWSDAEAMTEKVNLAKEFNLLGVALFKIDGQEDKKIWREF